MASNYLYSGTSTADLGTASYSFDIGSANTFATDTYYVTATTATNSILYHDSGATYTWAVPTRTQVDWGVVEGTITTASTYVTLDSQHQYLWINGENVPVKLDQEFITEEFMEQVKIQQEQQAKERKRQQWLQTLKAKRFEIRIQKAENRGLSLLQKLVDEEQFVNYKEKGFIEITSPEGQLYKLYADDSKKIEIYEKKPTLSIAHSIKEALTTAEKMRKIDQLVLNGETFILKRTVCTHHRQEGNVLPPVDAVVSKILHLRSGVPLQEFGNVYEQQVA